MKIDNQKFTIYYSPECPYFEHEVNELAEYSKENKIKINFIKIDTLEKAKNALAYFIIGQIFIRVNSFQTLY